MPIRFGLLGASRIAPAALIEPARDNPDVRVVSVAARDPQRAHEYATEQGIPVVHEDYESLLRADDVDAVYIGLPAALHGHFTRAALAAGKHVLCEKPLTANEAEAREVARAVEQSGLVMMQAFHYRYHELYRRVRAIIDSGELGLIQHWEAIFDVPEMPATDIRWDYGLGGGVTMDIGCYPIDLVRSLAGEEPLVTSAVATPGADPRVDGTLTAQWAFPDGSTASITGTMGVPGPDRQVATLTGTGGTLVINGFVHPQHGNRLVISVAGQERSEVVAPAPSSYAAQLSAFLRAVQDGQPFATDVQDAIKTMRLIDQCYLAAGLPVREPAS